MVEATVTGYDLETARAALPALSEYTYLNVGTEGLVAEPVLAEYLAATAAHDRYGHVGIARATAETDAARSRLAALLHCSADELAFTHNATDGTTLFASSVGWPTDSTAEVIISNEEHPAIIQPWYALAARGGPRVRQFTVSPDADETLANFAAVLSERTVAIAVSVVSCETGIRLPLQDMCDLARQHGAWCFLDLAQAVGQFDLSPRDLGADVATSNGHKWLCGPKGTGFLWVAAERLDALEPRFGAGTYTLGPLRETYTDSVSPRLDPLPTARRFEYGTRNFAPAAGLDAALRYRDALGPIAIEAHQAVLSTRLKHNLAAIPGVTVHTPLAWERSCGLVTFSLAGWRGTDLSQLLWDEYRIIQRRVEKPSGVRVSVAYFTNDADCTRLCEVIQHLRTAHSSHGQWRR